MFTWVRSNAFTVYVDGEFLEAITVNSNNPLTLGCFILGQDANSVCSLSNGVSFFTTSRALNGSLSAVSLYTSLLTPSDAACFHEACGPWDCPGMIPVGTWGMQAAGSVVLDTSASQQHLEIMVSTASGSGPVRRMSWEPQSTAQEVIGGAGPCL